ncbi:AraC family transcriptional regulator [Paenibacillus sp. J2TS4]|uniref:AraC family transcriptional regulator n=1 Tax=Paenibacillus sp. J2TS4 TaxID=2807194 RepID=UPI001B1FAFC0|nr:AraC family transcriptional regulator [Paenibacillus sp. J2TS4]GIP33259.1 AraC family transcriptional regulator [Paenibacillus sp. J2TS4]
MRLANYLNLNKRPIQSSLYLNRTKNFREIIHSHQGIELLYVHEGAGRVVIEQQLIDVVPGTLLCIRPYQLHHVRMSTEQGQSYIRSLFVFEPSVLSQYVTPFPSIYQFLLYLWKDPYAVQIIRPPDKEETDRMLKNYNRRIASAPRQDLTEENALCLVSFLHYLKPIWESQARTRSNSAMTVSDHITAIMHWIEKNYAAEFQLVELADAVHLSPNHVSYLFRKETGSSLTEYLTARRMKQACLLLRTSTLTVQEIGRRVGFVNFSYFCQLFKKQLGVTPLQYRSHRG